MKELKTLEKENKTDLQIDVNGIEEFANKVEHALELLKEASAILNDASNNTKFEIVVKTLDQK
ncbi:hypothetical protein [Virgibacillus proomii]|uniref:hypothetical protein n=1 Tax=Virgibacillus proomii TaxID=84407 RepID=UPI001C123705|nr:hypothetical protein [Virgibacillus proomii]MBU5268151.1 hypothetical protein [Virgibacillus proomii]